jgi:two-component system, NtrC family, response regulator AtoC
MNKKALVFVQDSRARQSLAETLEAEGVSVRVATTHQEAQQALRERNHFLLIVDTCPAEGDLGDFLGPGRGAGIEATILVDSYPLTEDGGPATFLAAPMDLTRLRTFLAQRNPSGADGEDEGRFGLLIGGAPAMRRLYAILQRIGPSQANVLITGESGSGKELVARTLHDLSPRRKGPFLPVNCGALTPSLMESELFGHERGSFTGADRRHRGFFERADGGTLFLDEITEMPAELQVKLLRVLETGLVVGVGREEPVRVDVRVLAATNRSPAAAVEEGRLREDLYYRLKVLQVDLPPLRERMEDLPRLADWFLREISKREGHRKVLGEEALELLQRHHWPGNVRELRNVLYTMYLLSPHETIPASVIPPEIHQVASGDGTGPWTRGAAAGRSLKEIEKHHILLTLKELDGHKRKAAEVLGVSLKTLYNRLHEYGEMGDNGTE